MIAMMKPIESSMCVVPMCFERPRHESVFCQFHFTTDRIGRFLQAVASILALFLAFSALMTLQGCAGPSKSKLRDLLSQCRAANRERVKIIKAYEGSNCATNQAQDFGTVNFSEAGN